MKKGEEIYRSDWIRRSVASRQSCSPMSAENDMASPHARSDLRTISGYQTLWESPAGIEDYPPQSVLANSKAIAARVVDKTSDSLATVGPAKETRCCANDLGITKAVSRLYVNMVGKPENIAPFLAAKVTLQRH